MKGVGWWKGKLAFIGWGEQYGRGRNIFVYGKENSVHEICCHKFTISHNPLIVRHTTVSKQLLTAHYIFKATGSAYLSFSEGIVKVL